TKVRYLAHAKHLAIVDESLSGESPVAAMAAGEEAARKSAPSSGAPAASAQHGVVTITNFAFSPTVIEISKGERVTWKNDDDVPHRIQSANAAFTPSAVLDTKASFGVTFAKPGRYEYFCSLHPKMTGSIVVR
ncbi:MAG: cupredoxin domain-containing protein, partial [bacterium]